MNSPVRLGVSPTAASIPTGVFSQRLEALFPDTRTLDCGVCLIPQLFLPVYLHTNVGPRVCQLIPHPVLQPLPCCVSSLPRLPISTPPTGLGECFFNSFVVGFPQSSVFWQFWLFFVFQFVVILWLCKEAQCIYLCLHLGWKSPGDIFKNHITEAKRALKFPWGQAQALVLTWFMLEFIPT